jgi:hypothetical protein
MTHFHRHFCSKVIVVLWRSIKPGPSLIHDNLPLLYVHYKNSSGNFSSWENDTAKKKN